MAKKTIQVVYQVQDRELLDAAKTLDKVEKEAKQADDAVKKFGNDAQKAGAQASKAGKDASGSFGNLSNIMDNIMSIGITAFFLKAGKAILDLGIKQEQLNIAFTTFLGSASKANKVLADLTQFAIVTPFSPDEVNGAAKALLAFGVQGEDIIPTLKMLGDVSAGTGKDLTEMAVIFGQIRSTGRLMGQDLLQLINAGFNPLQVISEKTGKSVADLKVEMEKGAISFEMVADAFKSATSEGGLFFNLMEKQSQSIGGKLSAISGNIEEVAKGIFESNIGLIGEFVDKLGLATDILLKWVKTANSNPIVDWANENSETYRKNLDEAIKTMESGAGTDAINKELENLRQEINAWKESARELENSVVQATSTEEANKFNTQLKVERQTVLNLKEMMDEYIKIVKKYSDAQSALAAANEATRQSFLKTYKLKPYVDSLDGLTKSSKAAEKALKDLHDANEEAFQNDAYKATMDEINKRREGMGGTVTMYDRDEYEKGLKAEEEYQKRMKDLRAEGLTFALNAIATLATAESDRIQKQLQDLQDSTAQQITLSGDNERAKDQIRAQAKIKEDALKKQQAQEDKKAALKKIAIDTAVNVIRSIMNNGGIPYGLPFGALALAAGVVQASVVGRYKDGGWITGPGSETSDSVPILASRNEYMVKASAAKHAPQLLDAINDRRIDDRILHGHNPARSGGSQAFNDERIVNAIQDNKVDYDLQGYTLMKSQTKGNKFKLHIRSKVQGY